MPRTGEWSSNMVYKFSRPPEELTCIIGNLFTELRPPCNMNRPDLALVLYGITYSGNPGILVIRKSECEFAGSGKDAEVIKKKCIRERKCGYVK